MFALILEIHSPRFTAVVPSNARVRRKWSCADRVWYFVDTVADSNFSCYRACGCRFCRSSTIRKVQRAIEVVVDDVRVERAASFLFVVEAPEALRLPVDGDVHAPFLVPRNPHHASVL